MLAQLRLQRPVQQPARQVPQQPVWTRDLLRRARARQQRIKDLIRDLKRLLIDPRPTRQSGQHLSPLGGFGSLRSPWGLAPLLARTRNQIWMNRCRCRHDQSFRSRLHGSSDTPARPADCWSKQPCTYRKTPALRKTLAERQKDQPPEAVAIAWTAQQRLHRTWTRLEARKKRRTLIAVAAARELLGFCWAITQIE